MAKGLLLKGYNGFYYVSSEDKIWTCSLRGKFRYKKTEFLPGDQVEFTALEAGKGVIEKVYDRTNRLVRPAVANIDIALITFAFTNPEPDFLLLDRILIQVLAQNIRPVICFNKSDLISGEKANAIMAAYQQAGYSVFGVSAKDNGSLERLKQELKGNIIVLAGPSGVGKSSIINAIQPDIQQETGTLSKKTDRGKHTTRRVELLPWGEDTYITDTPGFSSLYLPEELKKEDLKNYFPEMLEAAKNCPFKGCLHLKERDCEVKNDVKAGNIDSGRYERYTVFMEELKEKEGKYK